MVLWNGYGISVWLWCFSMVMASPYGYGISVWLWYFSMVMVSQYGYGISVWLWYFSMVMVVYHGFYGNIQSLWYLTYCGTMVMVTYNGSMMLYNRYGNITYGLWYIMVMAFTIVANCYIYDLHAYNLIAYSIS